MGTEARRTARSNSLRRSKWPMNRKSPVLPKWRRTRCDRWGLGWNSPTKVGIGGAGITSLWPKSTLHTPQWEHPSKEQSGTVASAKARCKSSANQALSMPVSKWSQGRGNVAKSAIVGSISGNRVLPLSKGELEGILASAEVSPLPNPPLAKGREWQPLRSWGTSTKPVLPCSKALEGVPQKLPCSSWRYFPANPASSIACVQAP